MKIQIGHLYLNQTKKYLFPVVKHYGAEFVKRIEALYKLAIGIGDHVAEVCGKEYNKHIYILVDVKATKNFLSLLAYFQQHNSYEADHAFDTIHKGHMHMIVIKVPSAYLEALKKFKLSKYSEMFSLGQIGVLFNPIKPTDTRRQVLLKMENYRLDFIKKIAEDFDVPIKDIKLDKNAELDFPISRYQEVFNEHKNPKKK